MVKVEEQIRERIYKKALKEFRVLYQGRLSRKKQTEIRKLFEIYVKGKALQYYKKQRELSPLQDTVSHLISRSEDSRIEGIFFDLLVEAEVPFKFQYQIGCYYVDFLIGDFLVFEIDGPQHKQKKVYDEARDKYMRRLGYQILRIEAWLLTMDPYLIINEIKSIISRKTLKKGKGGD